MPWPAKASHDSPDTKSREARSAERYSPRRHGDHREIQSRDGEATRFLRDLRASVVSLFSHQRDAAAVKSTLTLFFRHEIARGAKRKNIHHGDTEVTEKFKTETVRQRGFSVISVPPW